MADELPAHAILSTMVKLAKNEPDLPIEAICLSLADLLSEPDFQSIDGDLFGEIVLLGAALWRHTGEFRAAGESQTRQ